MMPLRSDRLAAWARTFAVQGSWNYGTLVGTGIAYAMLPLLRRIYAGDPVRLREAVERSMGAFNGHPYLCAMAVSALCRLEQDGTDPKKIERFRTALRGPLGTVGDRAVWAQWRPVCLLVGILAFVLGAGPVWSAAIFLVLYNAGHFIIRTWAFLAGWEAGLSVGRLLKGVWLERWSGRLWPLNLLLTGAVAVLLSARLMAGQVEAISSIAVLGLGSVTALAAFRFPRQGGHMAAVLLMLAGVLWFVGGLLG